MVAATGREFGLFINGQLVEAVSGEIRHLRQRFAGRGLCELSYTAFPGIPFGGYKRSGFGGELGLETLDLYLETKSVLVSMTPKPFNPFGL